jgi:hypothetical protein
VTAIYFRKKPTLDQQAPLLAEFGKAFPITTGVTMNMNLVVSVYLNQTHVNYCDYP